MMDRANTAKIGWIGIGRMGYAMAERLAKAGADVTVWNRTRAKAEPLAQVGAKIANDLQDLAVCDIVFVMVSAWKDVHEVVAGARGLLSAATRNVKLVVECSSISLEGSAELRRILGERGIDLLAAPVSGNAKVIKAGRLSFVCSGPRAAYEAALPYLHMIAPAASYVGEGELARIVKICHNVFLGVVTQSLAEITILAQKAGVPRHAFLDFINQSVMGSTFSRYKTPAFVNLDFTVTVFQHSGKELVHHHRLIFRKEEILNMDLPGCFDTFETDHVQSRAIDEEGNAFDVTDADEVCAVFDERDEHLPVTFDALTFSDVARDL